MHFTTLTSRDFNQRASDAKKLANQGPVFITDRGRPAHVLLSIEDYQRLAGHQKKITELLAMPGLDQIDLKIERSRELARGADLS